MIHVFSYRDKNYIYDVGSGSLHECDGATADFLRAREEGQDVDISYISDEQIKEILADVEGLKAQGLLFREETSARPVKSGEIKALCIHICHDCNFRCRYCFADEGAYHAEREFMSAETAKAAVDFLIENSGKRKVLEMDFFGGEPLMNLPVLKETVYYAKERAAQAGKKFLFTTTTNALLLNDDVIRFFNEEMENVVLSLDGRKEVHDAIRKTVNGKGSFDYVIGNIKKFVSLRGDKSYYVRGTFTAKNLDFSKDVLFIADQGADSISMEPVVTDLPDLRITEEHLPRIEKEYETLCDEYLKPLRGGEGIQFLPLQYRPRGRALSLQAGLRLRRGQRIFFRRPQRRSLSLPPIRGGPGISYGQRPGGHHPSGPAGKIRKFLPVYPQEVRGLFRQIHMLGRVQREQLPFLRRHRRALSHHLRDDEKADRVRDAHPRREKAARGGKGSKSGRIKGLFL